MKEEGPDLEAAFELEKGVGWGVELVLGNLRVLLQCPHTDQALVCEEKAILTNCELYL